MRSLDLDLDLGSRSGGSMEDLNQIKRSEAPA